MRPVAATAVLELPFERSVGSLPLYLQIAESLLDRIESGELAPGDRLPPERELSERLGVNRMTVRRALRNLEDQGLLSRRQGDGTYVAEPKIERQAARLVSFTRGMQRRGLTPGTRLISVELRPVEASLARSLRLPVAAPLHDILRLRLLNQEPVILERYLIPAARFPALDRFDLEGRSVYEILETEYGIAIRRARQSLEPVVAGDFEAGLLGIRPGAPLMLERRTGFDAGGEPVEHGRDLYRGDRFRFVTEMAPLER
ncbi:MAG TPA: GntR family transcriptional regulator [Anaerolineales bacterium]